MSAIHTVPEPARLPAELEEELSRFSPLPTIKGRDQAVAFLKDEVGITVAKYSITASVGDRSLEHFMNRRSLYFSPRGLVRWAVSQIRTAESA